MSKSIQQIQQELTMTEEAVKDLGRDLAAAYQIYLDLLSETVKKQLLLNSYYLCTQIYPESFLNLNFDRREKIQQTLRQISQIVCVLFYQYIAEIFKLSRSVDIPRTFTSNPPSPEPVASPKNTPDSQGLLQEDNSKEQSEKTSGLDLDKQAESEQENPDLVKINSKNTGVNSLVSIAALMEERNRSIEVLDSLKQTFQEKLYSANLPEDLLRCHKQIEKGISRSLEILNLEVNKKLQQAGILSQKIPAQLLEIPIHSGEAGTSVNSLPHLLELTIEIGNSSSQETENKTVTKIILLRLKISELEFVDFNLAKGRDRIRNLTSEIDRLRHLYSKLKKEYSIVRAEAAWRSSWYES
jgi:hypothetical protein